MNDIKQGSLRLSKTHGTKRLNHHVGGRSEYSRLKLSEYINILTGTIAEALENGKKVTISDFGTFQVSKRRSFKGRTRTGAPIKVPVRRFLFFVLESV